MLAGPQLPDTQAARRDFVRRTIALDPSDTFVFDVPAVSGEWAVSGAFRFCDQDPSKLSGKARAAFRSGFLGVQSWGWSTLAQIVPATQDDCQGLIELLICQRLLTARLQAARDHHAPFLFLRGKPGTTND